MLLTSDDEKGLTLQLSSARFTANTSDSLGRGTEHPAHRSEGNSGYFLLQLRICT